jgi:general stress protein 26
MEGMRLKADLIIVDLGGCRTTTVCRQMSDVRGESHLPADRLTRKEGRNAMAVKDPITELEPQFSSANASATSWAEARQLLEAAEVYWLTTVRPDGRPHVTPLLAVWLDGALYFSTGTSNPKAKNLVQNAHCILTTGCNALAEGLDLVVEGDAAIVRDEAMLQRVADTYVAKYGPDWRFTVRDGAFHGGGGNIAMVYEVTPTAAFGFRKGTFSQTRWRFSP